MKVLYEKWKQIIINNYNGVLDDETLDLFTVASLALYMKNQELVMKKLPEVFNKVDILSGEKKVSELLLAKYPNYPWNPLFDSETGMSTRRVKGRKKSIKEEWTLTVSTSALSQNGVEIFAIVIHELTHFLRFGGIKETKQEVIISDGISIGRLSKKNNELKKEHFYLEEAFVEIHTNEVMEYFYQFICSESDLSFSPCLCNFKETFKEKHNKNGYIFGVSVVESLSLNPNFRPLADLLFEKNSGIPELINYYNSVIGDNCAFDKLSKSVDIAFLLSRKGDKKGALEVIASLNHDIKKFTSVGLTKQKN